MFSKKRKLSFQIIRETLTNKTVFRIANEIGISHVSLKRLETGYYPISSRMLSLVQGYYGLECGKLLYLLDQLALQGIRFSPKEINLSQIPDNLKKQLYKKHLLFS